MRLEYHDEPPADDHGGWDDVVETPYRSRTGAVCLTTVTGAGERADLTLGGPGTYRVRVTRRYDEVQGDRWRSRFWPAEPEPPRWLTLPPEQVAALNRRQAQRYRGFATDILWTALWSRQNPFTVTVPALAERLLATPAEVRATLEFIATERLATVTGDGPVSIAVLPRRPPSTVDTPRPVVARRAARSVAVDPAPGPPPPAGVVTGAGEPVSRSSSRVLTARTRSGRSSRRTGSWCWARESRTCWSARTASSSRSATT